MLRSDCSGASNDYASLSHFDRNKSLRELFAEFQKQKLTTESNLKAFIIKICFVIMEFESSSNYLVTLLTKLWYQMTELLH